jgi:hypothetical protein
MFRISYVHHQKDYIIHAALYIMFIMSLCKQVSRWNDVLDIRGVRKYVEDAKTCVLGETTPLCVIDLQNTSKIQTQLSCVCILLTFCNSTQQKRDVSTKSYKR